MIEEKDANNAEMEYKTNCVHIGVGTLKMHAI